MKEPQIDQKTREYLKKWGRREVPTAQITGGTCTPGIYRGLPILGWIERKEGVLPVVGIHFLVLLNHSADVKASLALALPVTKNTELLVNSFLAHLGWDGRVWPYDGDGGWPEGDTDEDVTQIKALFNRVVPPIGATLTFPSKPNARVIERLPVLKRNAPYPWAPFEPVPEEAEGSPIQHLTRFRELCADPSPFSLQS